MQEPQGCTHVWHIGGDGWKWMDRWTLGVTGETECLRDTSG